jgi:hypothetical protein
MRPAVQSQRGVDEKAPSPRRIRHEIPEEPARRDSTPVSLSASTGSLKNMDALSRTKSAHPRNTRISQKHFQHLRTAMARTGRYGEEALHKAGVGESRSCVQC